MIERSGTEICGTGIAGTTATVEEALGCATGAVVTTVKELASMTATIPTRMTTTVSITGAKRGIFKGYYQVSRDTNACLHVFVRVERREEGFHILTAKMVFSHYAGLV